MTEHAWLAARFEEKRGHLRRVAYRMLGSEDEADDAVQDAWLRLTRSDRDDVENLGGWLTTVVARVCLDMLRSRKARREETLDELGPDPALERSGVRDAEQDLLLDDSIGAAMLLVLETLAPAERVAFVLHDMFDLSFDEIAPIVGRSAVAARQLASRARRRVRGSTTGSDIGGSRQREVVEAFLAASRGGDMQALLALLDPDVVLRADPAAVQSSAAAQGRGGPSLAPEVRGAALVGDVFSGRAKAARLALIDGVAGAVWAQGGTPRVAFTFEVFEGRIAAIDIVADPDHVGRLEVEIIEG